MWSNTLRKHVAESIQVSLTEKLPRFYVPIFILHFQKSIEVRVFQAYLNKIITLKEHAGFPLLCNLQNGLFRTKNQVQNFGT